MNNNVKIVVDAGHGRYWKIQIITNDYKCKWIQDIGYFNKKYLFSFKHLKIM